MHINDLVNKYSTCLCYKSENIAEIMQLIKNDHFLEIEEANTLQKFVLDWAKLNQFKNELDKNNFVDDQTVINNFKNNFAQYYAAFQKVIESSNLIEKSATSKPQGNNYMQTLIANLDVTPKEEVAGEDKTNITFEDDSYSNSLGFIKSNFIILSVLVVGIILAVVLFEILK